MEIHEQIREWQESVHEIGMLQFLKPEVVREKFIQSIPENMTALALCESEAVCVDAGSAEVVLLEHETGSTISCAAAQNQDSLVASLRVLESHFNRCVEDPDYCESENEAIKTKSRCVDLAGGEKFLGFFTSLVGY
ncbi:hypothetical protein [Marinobacter sediminicola]|uniref:hypothetical protein n=1 Tax=Marinobacter sediminicola TaxID=3072994 RepID=UPI0028128358|nr:hypothetical protein [Marinobacter sp. F26243]